MYDVVTLLGKILRLKMIVFILDVLMMAVFALSFFSLLIGYNGGQIRALFLIVFAAGFLVYICTVHRALVQVFAKVTKLFHKSLKK
ncbi:MAG: hypothetical protein IJ643_07485, partial [Eubacterium sp.]|nr:hypothetical protein [Eubacterium sp.]